MMKKLLEVGSKAGVGAHLLDAFYALRPSKAPGARFDIRVPTDRTEWKGRVVFPYVSTGDVHIYKYSILAKAFELRGWKPLFVVCDSSLPMCMIKEPDVPRDPAQCEYCEYTTRRSLDHVQCEVVDLSDHLSEPETYYDIDVDGIDTLDYRGVDLSMFAKSSVRKALKRYHVDDERHEPLVRNFISGGISLVDGFHSLLDTHDVRVMIAHDDKYNLGGIPLAVAEGRGINTYSTTFGWRNESLVMGNTTHRNSLPHYEATATVEPFLHQSLSADENEWLDRIMADRIHGDRDVRAQYSALTDESVSGSNDLTTVGMFTNLIWDANLEVENCPYPDVFDWISDTIHHVSSADDVELFIKPHPAEEIRGTNESVAGWIRHNYPELDERITVLSSDTEINTYEMIDDIDCGLVYNSTVGLEMALMDTPAVVAGETHYEGLGITFDPTDDVEYLNLLEDIESIRLTDRRKDRARRYAYFLFKGKHLDFPFIKTGEFSDEYRKYEFRPVRRKDIGVGNAVFDKIVDRCVNGDPVLHPDLDQSVGK